MRNVRKHALTSGCRGRRRRVPNVPRDSRLATLIMAAALTTLPLTIGTLGVGVPGALLFDTLLMGVLAPLQGVTLVGVVGSVIGVVGRGVSGSGLSVVSEMAIASLLSGTLEVAVGELFEDVRPSNRSHRSSSVARPSWMSMRISDISCFR